MARPNWKLLGLGLILAWGLLSLTTADQATAQEAIQAPQGKLPPYTGIIKNNTLYPLSIPSRNSDGTLIVPACGAIEYTVWNARFDLDAYYDGKAVWCDHIAVTPAQFSYMCHQYDFVAEITLPEMARPVKKHKSKLKKRVKRQKPC